MVGNGQQLPSISVPQAGTNASGDGSRGEGTHPSIREQGPRGGEQQHQQDACLQAVNPVKLKKSPGWELQAKQQEPSTTYNSTSSTHYSARYNSSANTNGHSNNNNGNNGSNRHQSKSRGPSGVFDSVPFTPSQGVTRTPSSSSGQFNFDPYWGWGLYGGRESPNMMLRGAPTDEQSGAFSSHMPFPPYLMAFSMAYPSNVEASSPQYAPPSPLMGSPVGTPTAMMFPQTPFAGTHGAHHAFSPYPGRHSGTFSLGSPTRNPPFPEPFSPNGMSPKGYGFFHPMFNNFPAFLVPPPRQRSSSGFTSPKKAPGGGYNGGNKQQQQQQLHKQERSSGESGESASTMEYGWDAGLSPWPPSSIGAPPMNDQGGGSMGPWGKFPPPFPPSPYGYGPSPRAPSCSGMPSYPMPMHLLPPMFAMHSSGTFNTVWPPSSSNCPPPGPPSPPPMGSSAKGRPSNGSTSTVATQPTNPYFLPASSLPPPPGAPTHSSMNTGGGGSSASSTCSSMFSMPTPAQSPPNPGAGSIASAVGGSSGGSSGKDSKKGKPRPPPLQLNALPGSGLHCGLPGIAPVPGAGAAGGPPGPLPGPMFFPPPGQHGPAMPIPSPAPFPTWDDSHPPMPDHPFGTSPPSQLPPHQPPGRAPTPPGAHPHPFFALPGHFGLAAPTPFMPMPFLPHMLQGNGMPLMAHMMPPGFPPGMAVPPPPPGHPFGHPMGPPPPGGHPASPYAHHPMHGPHPHLTPPNSSSKGRRPQQGPGQMTQHGTPGSAGGPGKVDTPPRLNARQRRTLRRAKERAIKGLMEAGHLALKNRQGGSPQQGMEGSPPSSKPKSREEELSGSDTEEAMKAASVVDNATASYYVSAAMSVVAGSHGPEAAANASEAISKVAADLDDVDLTNLISHLSQRKGEAGHQGGQPAAEEGLLHDLQIIQNLIGFLAQGGGAAGASSGTSATGARDGKEREGARKEGDDRERGPNVQGAGKGGRTGLPGQQQQQQQQQHQGRQAGVRQFGQQQQQQQGGHAGRAKPEGGQQPPMYHVRAMC